MRKILESMRFSDPGDITFIQLMLGRIVACGFVWLTLTYVSLPLAGYGPLRLLGLAPQTLAMAKESAPGFASVITFLFGLVMLGSCFFRRIASWLGFCLAFFIFFVAPFANAELFAQALSTSDPPKARAVEIWLCEIFLAPAVIGIAVQFWSVRFERTHLVTEDFQ